ncbi:MAG: capsular polysaccharide biosynthesis protein CapF [Thermoguttaceae bacterium]|nr:capsular polysaccharide biosynthesis protein CapF [Thermoguttaceae bacterium]
MKILVTGAKGFVGKNLVAELKNIKEGKAKNYSLDPDLTIFEYDVDSAPAELDEYCRDAEFVFNLAGVNRPKDAAEFMAGNFGFASVLLETLKKYDNRCPVMISSSTQAALDNPYGQSKKAGEDLFFQYGAETGAKTLVYRFPNLFGKWCRPNYNSVIATFCNNVALGAPIQINDPSVVLTLAYVDDVVRELIAALSGNEHRCAEDSRYCVVPTTHVETLGRIAELIQSFKATRETLGVPDMSDPFVAKLYATYTSYLPPTDFAYPLTMRCDARGSFTEILRTADRGQFSVNVSKPGITKGEHWHHTKNEKFLVVSGKGVIRFRKPGEEQVYEYFVSGEKLEVVDIPVGYTHNIENLGEVDMVTFMWCSECFDPNRPDTFFLPVKSVGE